jgi:hypothetical protein
MRLKYAEKLQQKQRQESKVVHTLLENKVLDKNISGYQAVKMIFIDEKDAANPDWKPSESVDQYAKDKDGDYINNPYDQNDAVHNFDNFKSKFVFVIQELL